MTKLFDEDAVRTIDQEKHQWQKVHDQQLTEGPQHFESLSGIPIDPLYTPADIAHMDYQNDVGFPGQAPYVRGVYPTMYRGRTWTLRQLAGFGPPEQTNKRYKFLLQEGATGINGVFDYPTLRGFDSTDPFARADAGRGGVAIDTIEDMRILFDGIPIEKISTSLVTCQPICNITVQSMYFANAQMRHLPLNHLTGTSQNDFLMETVITVSPEILPPEVSFKLSCDAIEYCSNHATRWNPISFSGYNYREAGCSAPQEIAFVIANAIACSEELLRRGYDVDAFAPRLSFFLSAHSDFFEEIAKYRAARRIWFNIMKERFKAKDPRSLRLRFHVQTAGVALTAQQPLNNISRAAYHGLSAVLGGAQSVHIDGYDEALCTPTELSSLTALRTNQILQLETRVIHTINPLGGSYFVESLTNEVEAKAEKLLETIDYKGGIVKSVETGWIHIQEQKLKKIKTERDESRVKDALDAVARCCEKNENLMEVVVESVKAYATLGEISQTLKRSYGTWNPPLF
ncbi:MAG: methylmalonyl-CoA mutase family protein [Deltaproteobacteria bacterium]